MKTNKVTKIVCGFPGIGKSVYHKNNPDTSLDSDSSLFSWINGIRNGTRDPSFPANYIKHIKENIGKYNYILVSSHAKVREALKAECLFYYFVYPSVIKKTEYMKRYVDRANDGAFIQMLDSNWEEWVLACDKDSDGSKLIELLEHDYIEQVLI